MNISVNNMLDAGTLVHGKLPDIYWELDLSGTEIKVLRYVYNHCLRLYNTLRIFPRRGRMAWVSLDRAVLAEPPAESPSTM